MTYENRSVDNDVAHKANVLAIRRLLGLGKASLGAGLLAGAVTKLLKAPIRELRDPPVLMGGPESVPVPVLTRDYRKKFEEDEKKLSKQADLAELIASRLERSRFGRTLLNPGALGTMSKPITAALGPVMLLAPAAVSWMGINAFDDVIRRHIRRKIVEREKKKFRDALTDERYFDTPEGQKVGAVVDRCYEAWHKMRERSKASQHEKQAWNIWDILGMVGVPLIALSTLPATYAFGRGYKDEADALQRLKLSRIVKAYGSHLQSMRPQRYTIVPTEEDSDDPKPYADVVQKKPSK